MLNLLKDPAKRAEWVYGQPMAPCPKCGSYNMKPQMPIAMETTGDETAPQLLGKWARATKAGATAPRGWATARVESVRCLMGPNVEVQGCDAASSRRVPCNDGLGIVREE